MTSGEFLFYLDNMYFAFIVIASMAVFMALIVSDYTKKMILFEVAYSNVILFLVVLSVVDEHSRFVIPIVVTIFIIFIFTFLTGSGIIANIVRNQRHKKIIDFIENSRRELLAKTGDKNGKN